MKQYRIAILGGDGIGPEVCRAAVSVVEAAIEGIAAIEWEEVSGGARSYLDTGEALPVSTIERCRAVDAILLGAAGLPEARYPDGTEAGQDATLKLRFELDLFANIRPIHLYDGVATPLANRPKIDYVIVRENSEGLYASRGGGSILRGEVAADTLLVTRRGVERIVRQAADLCLKRSGAPADGKRRVTICDKANVLRSYAFFRSVATETLAEYPEIEIEFALVDALSMYLVTNPEHYDVIVTENMFGDILSDLGAATIGGLGMADSAELGEECALFQASHGSAPDIAGKGIANPIATILSSAGMLEWLARRHSDRSLAERAQVMRSAIAGVLAGGSHLTQDLGGAANTQECVDAIIRNLSERVQ